MTETDGLRVPRRYWAIGGISLGITLAVIDSAIANVALPTIAADLNAEPAHSIWVVNGYQLAITVALLPLSSLGDRIGYRNVYVPGLAGISQFEQHRSESVVRRGVASGDANLYLRNDCPHG